MSVYKGDKVISIYKGDKLIADSMAAGTSTVTPQYIRDQNLLDMTNEAQLIEEATSKAKAVQMPYDGILNIQSRWDSGVTFFVLDKNKQQKYSMNYNGQGKESGDAGNLVFCKDDYVYFETGNKPGMALYFYKKRDYTGR